MMNHGATGASADVVRPNRRREAMPRLQVLDVLLLNDLNLVLGLFDAVFCTRFQHVSFRLKAVVATRLVLQTVGFVLLIYYGRRHHFSFVGAVMVLVAAALFLMTRHKFKILASEQGTTALGAATSWWVAYIVMYLLPVAGFLNLGVALNPDFGKERFKVVGWAVQLGLKFVIVVVLVLYAMYYHLYAEAWHCYKRESDLSEYKYGYCPSYTHQGSYMDPSNKVCRPPNNPLRCYGDRHAENLPRNWLAHGRWTYTLLLIPVHITIAQAVAGVNGVYSLLDRA
jgi:hypothetical protein